MKLSEVGLEAGGNFFVIFGKRVLFYLWSGTSSEITLYDNLTCEHYFLKLLASLITKK